MGYKIVQTNLIIKLVFSHTLLFQFRILTYSKLQLDPLNFLLFHTILYSILQIFSHISEHSGIHHIHMREIHHGLPVVNVMANVNIDKYGNIISSGYIDEKALSTPMNRKAPPSTPKITASEAAAYVADLLLADKNDEPFVNAANKASTMYFLTPSSKLELVWELYVDLTSVW